MILQRGPWLQPGDERLVKYIASNENYQELGLRPLQNYLNLTSIPLSHMHLPSGVLNLSLSPMLLRTELSVCFWECTDLHQIKQLTVILGGDLLLLKDGSVHCVYGTNFAFYLPTDCASKFSPGTTVYAITTGAAR